MLARRFGGEIFVGRVKISHAFAVRFCETLAQSDQAIFNILKAHPEWPQWRQLRRWREKHEWFAQMWRRAREDQGEHLAQKCLDLASLANPKNAHQCRVQFDIYKWVASRFSPAVYGDRPSQTPTVNVGIGVTISNERLNEIRSKLELTRAVMIKDKPNGTNDTPETKRLPTLIQNPSKTKGLTPESPLRT